MIKTLETYGIKPRGATPGPACYGAGGVAATITDVNLLLGYLNADGFLGGEMRLDSGAAERAIAGVASRIGLDPLQAAAGAFRIVNANMADLIRRSSIDRGRDARDFVLFAYGGAGALHIAYLARDLGIAKIYVPSFATVFSALGMLTGGIVHGAERSCLDAFPLVPERWRELGAAFKTIENGLDDLFHREGIEPRDRRYARFAHIKYRLQPRANVSVTVRPAFGPSLEVLLNEIRDFPWVQVHFLHLRRFVL